MIDHPIIREFQNQVKAKYPSFAGIIERDYATFGETWAEGLAHDLVTMFGEPGDARWAEAIRGYALFSLDALKSQRFFEKNGHYAASNYAEIKRDYWDNSEFMLANYLPGMFISYHLWPHHYRLLQFYTQEVLPVVARQTPQHFCEIGTGTAIYSRQTLFYFPNIRGYGYDISAHSLSFGERVLRSFGVIDRYQLEQRDIMADPPPPVDYLICQEVLEHLDDPAGFTQALRRLILPGGLAYITAAVTAGHSDHMYLFHSPDEVKTMLEAAGFSILMDKTEQAESANDPTIIPRVSCYLCSGS